MFTIWGQVQLTKIANISVLLIRKINIKHKSYLSGFKIKKTAS